MKILLKDLLEIEFIKQPAREQIHVTSNPFFAFHDDVFPAFAKNAAAQPRFPPSLGQSSKTRARTRTREVRVYWNSGLGHLTIIPDNFFSSLEELNHISTIETKVHRTKPFEFELNFPEGLEIFEETKILELTYFDGSTFLSFGAFSNNSVWIDSDYLKARSFLETKITKLSKLEFHFDSSSSMETSLEIFEEQ